MTRHRALLGQGSNTADLAPEAAASPVQAMSAAAAAPNSAAVHEEETPSGSTAGQSRPFRIHFDFQLGSNATAEQDAYLRELVLPMTASVLRQFIRVCVCVDDAASASLPCLVGVRGCRQCSAALLSLFRMS